MHIVLAYVRAYIYTIIHAHNKAPLLLFTCGQHALIRTQCKGQRVHGTYICQVSFHLCECTSMGPPLRCIHPAFSLSLLSPRWAHCLATFTALCWVCRKICRERERERERGRWKEGGSAEQYAAQPGEGLPICSIESTARPPSPLRGVMALSV